MNAHCSLYLFIATLYEIKVVIEKVIQALLSTSNSSFRMNKSLGSKLNGDVSSIANSCSNALIFFVQLSNGCLNLLPLNDELISISSHNLNFTCWWKNSLCLCNCKPTQTNVRLATFELLHRTKKVQCEIYLN